MGLQNDLWQEFFIQLGLQEKIDHECKLSYQQLRLIEAEKGTYDYRTHTFFSELLYCSPLRNWTFLRNFLNKHCKRRTKMKQRKWDSKTKAKVVLEGLKGKSVANICNEYQISQSLYYQWKDQFMNRVDQVFDLPKKGVREAKLQEENRRLKTMIGDLTIELKKNQEEEWA